MKNARSDSLDYMTDKQPDKNSSGDYIPWIYEIDLDNLIPVWLYTCTQRLNHCTYPQKVFLCHKYILSSQT